MFPSLLQEAAAWTQWVDEAAAAAPRRAAKCLRRECIEGLAEALAADAAAVHAREDCDGPGCGSAVEWQQLEPPFTSAQVADATTGRAGGGAAPQLLRGALRGWRPFAAWDGEGLRAAAGDDEVDVAVVQEAGSFEVCRCPVCEDRRPAVLRARRASPPDHIRRGCRHAASGTAGLGPHGTALSATSSSTAAAATPPATTTASAIALSATCTTAASSTTTSATAATATNRAHFCRLRHHHRPLRSSPPADHHILLHRCLRHLLGSREALDPLTTC